MKQNTILKEKERQNTDITLDYEKKEEKKTTDIYTLKVYSSVNYKCEYGQYIYCLFLYSTNDNVSQTIKVNSHSLVMIIMISQSKRESIGESHVCVTVDFKNTRL